MSIPEECYIVLSDKFGTETVAFEDWEEFKKEWLECIPESEEFLDEMEAMPEEESEIFSAELQKQETEDSGIYMIEKYLSYDKKFVRYLYRIYWDDSNKGWPVVGLGEADEEDED